MKMQPGALLPYTQPPPAIDVTRGTSMRWDTTFRDNNLRNHDIDTLKRWVRHKLGGYHVPINSIRADNLLYRGVRWGVRPTRVSQVSYPSADVLHLIGLGRANREGRAMFYASRAAPAVFYEVRARAGDTIALSEWGLSEQLWMHNLGYHPDALKHLGTPAEITRPQLSAPIPGESAEHARVRRRLSMSFAAEVQPRQDYRYKLSVAISETFFDGAEPLPLINDGFAPSSTAAAGIVYPSMQLRGGADNVVIWPDFVEKYLRIRSILFIKVLHVDELAMHYELQTIGAANEFADGDIVWRETMPPEIECRTTIRLENGFLTMRNGHGHLYDAHRI